MSHIKDNEKEHKPIVGITHGDFNGIGYEIIIKSLMEARILEFLTPVVYGSSKIASYYRKAFNINEFNFNLVKKAEQAVAKRANIVNVTEKEVKIDMGLSTEFAGQLALAALNMAVEDLKDHKIDVVVTAPINKKNIQSEGFRFKGHTEFFASKFNVKDYLMIMVAKEFRIGFVTGHTAVSQISQAITVDEIVRKLIVMNNSLIRDFGVVRPKIAVLGLNPHSGDNGVIGNEESEIIIPAIKKAQDDHNIFCFGPFPADGFFGNLLYRQYDGVMAMYHDQGMIAFKIIAFEEGVNYTAGLPIIRTSPAHGTAYEIAGKNIASFDSMRSAISLACEIYNNRKHYDQLNSNPLKIGTYKSADDEGDN